MPKEDTRAEVTATVLGKRGDQIEDIVDRGTEHAEAEIQKLVIGELEQSLDRLVDLINHLDRLTLEAWIRAVVFTVTIFHIAQEEARLHTLEEFTFEILRLELRPRLNCGSDEEERSDQQNRSHFEL